MSAARKKSGRGGRKGSPDKKRHRVKANKGNRSSKKNSNRAPRARREPRKQPRRFTWRAVKALPLRGWRWCKRALLALVKHALVRLLLVAAIAFGLGGRYEHPGAFAKDVESATTAITHVFEVGDTARKGLQTVKLVRELSGAREPRRERRRRR